MTRHVTAASGIRVRRSAPADREGLLRLGHSPTVARACAPPLWTRLLWALLATRAEAFVAQERRGGPILGSVQFVRAWRYPETWMFGHWRVVAARRRRGLGTALLREGARILGGVPRLYSYVERGNESSIAAHLRLGFELSPVIQGRAPIGALSTIGPTAPAPRLRPVPRAEVPALFPLFGRAMGGLWLRLHPGLAERAFLLAGDLPPGRISGLARPRPLARGRLFAVGTIEEAVGFVCWRGPEITLYTDPRGCDAALLARVAMQLLAQGAPRDRHLELRGLPLGVVARPGPIVARVLMGMTDAGERLAASPPPGPLPCGPCGPR